MWVYYDFDVVKKCVETLLRQPQLDIVIIENKSASTEEKFKPYFLDLLQQERIKKYLLFEENITNNAWEMAVSSPFINLYETEYIMLTDGDLSTDDDGWFDEAFSIISKPSNKVFAVGVDLLMANVPEQYKNANWIPKPTKDMGTHYEAVTGTHFCFMRSDEFREALNYIKSRHLPFRDTSLHTFCFRFTKKKWARTKKHKLYHHTWDYLHDPANEYNKKKTETWSFVWDHDTYCSYIIYTKDTTEKYEYFPHRHGGRNMNEYRRLHNMGNTPAHINPKAYTKLHIGCGTNYLYGWYNVDSNKTYKVDLMWDVRKSLPLQRESFEFIYNEHFIEHLTVAEAVSVFTNCFLLLKPGGILRLATPDITDIVRYYQTDTWKDLPIMKTAGLAWVKTKCEYINVALRSWGHQYLYDEEELRRRLKEAGFTQEPIRKEMGKSDHAPLCNLETRDASTLIVEVSK